MCGEKLLFAMHLKQTGYVFGVLLIYTITTITLPPAGWCQPAVYSTQPTSGLALHDDRNGAVTEKGVTHPSEQDYTEGLLYLLNVENRQGEQTTTSGGRTGQRLRMVSTSTDKALKNLDKPTQTNGGWTFASPNPPNKDCSEGKVKPIIRGKFYITGQLETYEPKVGYQADSAVSVRAHRGQQRVRGQRVSSSEESWQRLQPVVECGDDAMTLTVRRRRAVQLRLDRGNESSVPLSQLPPHCGYSVQTTSRDLTLMAPYEACHVTQEDNSYVLPLLWRETPVKMSCSVSAIQPQAAGPPSLCCSPHGMTVKVQGPSAAEELRVNVRGEWTPFVVLAEECGYTVDRRDAEIFIAAPFITCGITVKDGKYTLFLQIGEKMFSLACPVSPPEDLPHSHLHLSQSLKPFPWTPPFFLAPPYYPHPTYHRSYLKADGLDAYEPPNPSSSTLQPTIVPQPLPPADYQNQDSHQIPLKESYTHDDHPEDSGQVYTDLQQKKETPVLALAERHSSPRSPSDTGFPIQVEVTPLQSPHRAPSQYYHYYHHPKIPLLGPPDPRPDVSTDQFSNNAHNPEFPALAPNIHQSEALSRDDSDQLDQPVSPAASHPHTLSASSEFVQEAPAPYPPQPYPYHYFHYFPHIARGVAKRLTHLGQDSSAKTNSPDYQNVKSSRFLHPLPRSSGVQNPYMDKMFNFQRSGPDWYKKNPITDGMKAEPTPVTSLDRSTLRPDYPSGPNAVSPQQPSFSTLSPNLQVPYSYYNYYFPYHYHQMYREILPGVDNYVSSSEDASDPHLQASTFSKPQTTTAPTKSMHDVHAAPHDPFYYHFYHHYHQPKLSIDNQQEFLAGEITPEKASSKSGSHLPSDSDYSQSDRPVHAGAEEGYPSIPQPLYSPSDSLYSHYINRQQPYDPFEYPDGEENLDYETKEKLEADSDTPSASPCGFGSVSDFDCSVSSGCCSYLVKDCTTGQHLIFAVPDSAAEPTAAPTAPPFEVGNVSCTLQRLTSNPDLYIVPLDGCGVNKQVFGQTMVHLLEVHSIHSLQRDHSSVHEKSPVRLMVEGSSSKSSPGEVKLRVMDPPPPVQSVPTTVTVQLRIATDESFTNFHPEAHLPLSVIGGRVVYLELSLLDPPEPHLVLLVHSCLAYTQAPYTSWILVYDGCPSRGDSQLLPSPPTDPHQIRRIIISSFLPSPTQSPYDMAEQRYSYLEDPEIYFLCLTQVCSAAEGDCTVGCVYGPDSDM